MHTRASMLLMASLAALMGCGAHAPPPTGGTAAQASPTKASVPAILMIVRLKPGLSDEEMERVLRERAALFREVPGLLQKYYVRERDTGAYSGVYVWDSEASLKSFRESELAKSIPGAYRVTEPPKIEIYRILFPLRD